MPENHAVLSASGSKRWINCPPSARLEEQFPNESSPYAEEGTWAHSLNEYKIKRYLHEPMERPQSEYLTEEIEQLTDVYAEFVISTIEEIKKTCPNPLVMVEEQLDFSHIVPDGFGTADTLIIADGEIHICDFKTGAGVFVDADHNSQMMLYALGALHTYEFLYPIQTVKMTIVQPRLDNISTFTCSVDELKEWGESIRPIAQMAYEGKGEEEPGEWCQFCRARPVCRACADEALSLARDEFLDLDAMEQPFTEDGCEASSSDNDSRSPGSPLPVFKQPAYLTKEEIEEILPTLNRISSWIDAVFAYVSSEAINHGTKWKGFKVVEGRSNRRFTDTKAVADAAALAGYTQIYKQQMLSLTEIEKLMGKKDFRKILGKYVEKPPGKLTLVSESDPRPEADLSTVKDEFSALD